MRSHYRAFDRKGRHCTRELKVTIRSDGTLSLSWFADETLGCPRLVRPTFDEHIQVLRLARARVKDAQTFGVYREGSSALIAARNFMKRFGIDTSQSRRYEATVQDGKLLVDLKQQAELVSRSGGKRREANQAAAAGETRAEEEEQPPADQLTSTETAPDLERIMPLLIQLVEEYQARRVEA